MEVGNNVNGHSVLCWTNKCGERLIPPCLHLGGSRSTSHHVYLSNRVHMNGQGFCPVGVVVKSVVLECVDVGVQYLCAAGVQALAVMPGRK